MLACCAPGTKLRPEVPDVCPPPLRRWAHAGVAKRHTRAQIDNARTSARHRHSMAIPRSLPPSIIIHTCREIGKRILLRSRGSDQFIAGRELKPAPQSVLQTLTLHAHCPGFAICFFTSPGIHAWEIIRKGWCCACPSGRNDHIGSADPLKRVDDDFIGSVENPGMNAWATKKLAQQSNY